MNDPSKNPYTKSSTAPGGRHSGGQGLGTINSVSMIAGLIGYALIGGVIIITAILSFLVLSDPPEDQSLFRFDKDSMVFLAIGYFVFFSGAVASVVVRRILKWYANSRFKASGDELPHLLQADSPLPASAQTFLGSVAAYTLVGQALLEGPAVINAVFLLIQNNFAHLIPIVLAVIGIAIQIPTRGKLTSLLEDASR